MSSESIQELARNTKELIERVQTLKNFGEKSRSRRASIKAEQEHNQKLLDACIAQGLKLKVSSPDEFLALLRSRFDESKALVDVYGQELKGEHEAFQALEKELKDLDEEA